MSEDWRKIFYKVEVPLSSFPEDIQEIIREGKHLDDKGLLIRTLRAENKRLREALLDINGNDWICNTCGGPEKARQALKENATQGEGDE